MQRKDLHTALVAHPPVFGALVKSFNADAVKAVPGVTHVVELPSGVAVVGRNFWAVKKGRDALKVDWDLVPNAKLPTSDPLNRFTDKGKSPRTIGKKSDN